MQLKTVVFEYLSHIISIFVAEFVFMRLFAIILTIFVAFPFSGNAQRKRAFMVGISNYHSNGYKVWNNIHGAEDVKLLMPELEKKGFKVQSLINEEATYQRVIDNLSHFIISSKKGDIVYLHFSCHGQPVEDGLKGDSLDESDHWDEAIVPIDAEKEYNAKGYKGEKHITDDELNIYFSNLRKKIGSKGILYVAMDACHAGEMSREDGTVRGTNEGLTKTGTKYNPPRTNVSHYYRDKEKDMAPALFFEACQSRERNTEIIIKGKEYGALSYNIWQALQVMPSLDKKSKDEFKTKVDASTKVKGRWPQAPTQTLVIESSF